MVEWDGTQYIDIETYYKRVVLSMPQDGDALLGAMTHLNALTYLGCSKLFVAETDEMDIYVDAWLVNGAFITHKHPEFGVVKQDSWVTGMVECGLRHRACELCGKVIPGEIEMMHHFYRLDN